jgi:hypothetical protein
MALAGLAGIVFRVLMVARPGEAALAVLWLIATWSCWRLPLTKRSKPKAGHLPLQMLPSENGRHCAARGLGRTKTI